MGCSICTLRKGENEQMLATDDSFSLMNIAELPAFKACRAAAPHTFLGRWCARTAALRIGESLNNRNVYCQPSKGLGALFKGDNITYLIIQGKSSLKLLGTG